MREAFEEAAARLGYKLVVANPADQTGEYRDVETEDAWAMWQEACAWQAARAQSGQGVEPLAWVSEDATEVQKVSGRSRRLWWENNTGVGFPIYTHPQPAVPEGWRECLQEMVQAMHDYEMSVDEDAPYKHRAMMDRAHALLSTPATLQPAGPEWMRKLSENLATQDNRITQDPLFVVFQKREIVVDEEFDHDRISWGNEDGEVDDHIQDRLNEMYDDIDGDFWREDEIELTDEETGTGTYRRVALKEVDEFVTACFTEVGANDYLKANGHNLTRPHIYVTSLYRNEEMKRLREWLLSTPTTPQVDGPISGADRVPVKSDGDYEGKIWIFDTSTKQWFRGNYWEFGSPRDSHWMPTGLKRPQPPAAEPEK
jgi:hypothetical protein